MGGGGEGSLRPGIWPGICGPLGRANGELQGEQLPTGTCFRAAGPKGFSNWEAWGSHPHPTCRAPPGHNHCQRINDGLCTGSEVLFVIKLKPRRFQWLATCVGHKCQRGTVTVCRSSMSD